MIYLHLKVGIKMAKAKNKEELLIQVEDYYTKMIALIHTFTEEQKTAEFPFPTMNRNIRDLLAHVYEWQLMLEKWYEVGMTGEKPEIPAPGYTWKTTPELNRLIHEKYSQTPLATVLDDLEQSHKRQIDLITKHSTEELFTKKLYKWTNSTSLSAYFNSSTISHYTWATKFIKKYKKTLS